jgi:hypothetical protein
MMKGILSAIALIAVFSALGFLPSVSAQSSYGPSWEEHCTGNTCTRTLYSGVMYADSSGTSIENVSSLKHDTEWDVWDVVYLEVDPDFVINVTDFNVSSVSMDLNFTGNWSDYPEYCNETQDGAVCKFKMEVKYQEWNETMEDFNEIEIEYEYEFELEDGVVSEKQEFRYYENPLGRVFKFGGNSTTIQLQDADTENLEDVQFDEDTVKDGTDVFLIADLLDGTGEMPFIKFNISDVPISPSYQFDDATLCLYASTGSDENVDIWYSDNQTWLESEIDGLCANVYCSNLSGFFTTEIKTHTGSGSNGVWECIDGLEDSIDTEIDNGNTNITFILNNTGDTADFYQFYSKEHGTVANRPYLNITYSLDTSAPNISIVAPSNNTFTTDTGLVINYTASDSGSGLNSCWYSNDTMLVNTTIACGTNITTITWSDGEHTVKIWTNDSANNINSANVTFTVDTNAPTYQEPSYLSTVEEPNPNPISIAVSDLTSFTCNIDIDGTNYSMTVSGGNCSYSFTKAVSATETINFTIYMNDSVSNSNSTSQYSFTMTNAGASGGEAGGGGGSSFIVYGPDCGDYRATPADFSGASEPGTDMGMFILKIRNGADEQSFDATLSDNLRSFCGFDGDTHLEMLPNMEGQFMFQCEAPNGTISGYIEFRSSTGCVDSRPVVISGGAGFWADISYSVMLLGVGDIGGAFNNVEIYGGFGVPFGALVIIIFLGITGVFMWVQNQ